VEKPMRLPSARLQRMMRFIKAETCFIFVDVENRVRKLIDARGEEK
jgi:hypothetical protein